MKDQWEVPPLPKEIRFKGVSPWGRIKKSGKDAIALSKDVGGLTLVGIWIRTDSFEFTEEEE
jgi:hypothetical protein